MDPEPSQALSVNQSIELITQKLEAANLHYGHGAIDAQSEALWIVSKQLGLSPADALDHLDQILTSEQHQQALSVADERITSRKPLAYILGEAWLMGVPFFCSEQSIVPRSWIAELIVDGSLEPWLPQAFLQAKHFGPSGSFHTFPVRNQVPNPG